jgi:hypothetical protein
MFSLLGALLVLGSGLWAYHLTVKNADLKENLQRYSNISSLEEFRENLSQEIQSKQQQASYFTDQCDSLGHLEK